MIETTKRPYELLVRWRDGKISGAHVGFELTTTEDGKVLSTSPLPVMAVDLGKGVGFPLKDILGQLHIDAVIQMDAANAECSKREATIASLQATISEMEAASAKAKKA